MAAYARGCAAAQVDNLRDEYGPARPRYKKGDRVRTKGYEGTRWDGEGTIVSVDGYYNIVEIDGDRGGFSDHELEPVTLQLEAGKYYRTRDGRKVGPAEPNEGGIYVWNVPHEGCFYGYTASGSSCIHVSNDDLMAEWVDEPPTTTQPTHSNDNSTAGFTVPLCAYDDDTVELTALGRAYLSGWRDAQQAQAA